MTYENLGLRLPEIGRVKLGQKGEEKISTQGNKFQAPEKLDHFRIVTLGRGADNNLEIDTKAHEVYGEKPKRLVVRPISGKLEENIQAGYALYSKHGVRLCFGDGQTGNRIDIKTGEITAKVCPCNEYEENRCKKYAKASFFLDKVGGLGGVHTMTIKGKITVPCLIGSLKYLTEICDQAGGSISGIALELRLNEVMTKYGKVYSPYYLFPGTTEELVAAAQKAVNSKFRVLAEETDEADDTEEDDGGAEYPMGKETVVTKAESEEQAQYDSEQPKDKSDVAAKKPESRPAEQLADKTAAQVKENTANQTQSTGNKDGEKNGVAAGESQSADSKKSLKAFWCDSCHRISNSYTNPGVCKCGCTKMNEAVDMKAAQEAVKKASAKSAQATAAATTGASHKVLTFWCQNCCFIIESATKPVSCNCDKTHWHMASNPEEAQKAIDALIGKTAGEQLAEATEKRAEKIGALGANIKKLFGSSAQAAILKQVSLLLNRQIDSSSFISDEELEELEELMGVIAEMPKNDRDMFITSWKQGRAERLTKELLGEAA